MNLGAARHSAARSSTPRRRRPTLRVDTDATSDARASLSPPNPTSPPPDPRRDDSPRSSRPEGNRRDALARPRLVIREVVTRTKGRGRVKPRRAELETFAHVSPDDGSAVDPLASLPRVDGASARAPRRLPSPRLSRRDATRRRRDTHRPAIPRDPLPDTRLATQPEEDTGELPTDPPPKYPHYVTRDDADRVPRLDWTDRAQRARAEDRMRRSLPVVLRNTGIVGHVEPPRGVDRAYVADRFRGLLHEWGEWKSQSPSSDDDVPGFDRLAALGDGDARKWRCLVSSRDPDRKHRFDPVVERHNARGCVYRVRAPETSRAKMSAREFARCASTWNERGVLLCDDVAVPGDGKSGDGISGDGSGAIASAPVSLVSLVPVPGGDGLGGSAIRGVDWSFVHALRASQKFGAVRAIRVVAGVRDSLLPLHHPVGVFADEDAPKPSDEKIQSARYVASDFDDAAAEAARAAAAALSDDAGCESLQCQVIGRRRVLLISPDVSYRGLYPYPTRHPLDGRSMVNLESVDYASFPKFADVRGEIAVVEPGDCLYIPDRWWRHEHGLTSRHAQCEIRTGVGGRIRTRAQTTLRCGRATEERVCDAVGVAAAKTWVNVFAEGEEAAWCDLSTVDGAARCHLAREIRDEIDLGLPPPRRKRDDANVNAATTTTTTTTTTRPSFERRRSVVDELHRGRGRWAVFLRELADGRMEPTEWLDDGFVDPLFLSEALAVRGTERARLEAPVGDEDQDEEWRDAASERTALAGVEGTELVERNAAAADVSATSRAGRRPARLEVALPNGGPLTLAKKTLPDDRNETERQFPEFFVDRLKSRGWTDARHTPVSALNPEHPEFIGKKKNEGPSARSA